MPISRHKHEPYSNSWTPAITPAGVNSAAWKEGTQLLNCLLASTCVKSECSIDATFPKTGPNIYPSNMFQQLTESQTILKFKTWSTNPHLDDR